MAFLQRMYRSRRNAAAVTSFLLLLLVVVCLSLRTRHGGAFVFGSAGGARERGSCEAELQALDGRAARCRYLRSSSHPPCAPTGYVDYLALFYCACGEEEGLWWSPRSRSGCSCSSTSSATPRPSTSAPRSRASPRRSASRPPWLGSRCSRSATARPTCSPASWRSRPTAARRGTWGSAARSAARCSCPPSSPAWSPSSPLAAVAPSLSGAGSCATCAFFSSRSATSSPRWSPARSPSGRLRASSPSTPPTYVLLVSTSHCCSVAADDGSTNTSKKPSDDLAAPLLLPVVVSSKQPPRTFACGLLAALHAPLYLPRRLTIPDIAGHRWSRPNAYAITSTLLGPLLLAAVTSPTSPTVLLAGALTGTLFAIAAAATTDAAAPPHGRYARLLWLTGGFLMSILWS
ncbi:hypothetical protein VPH35_095439 [Triticum aestivum]